MTTKIIIFISHFVNLRRLKAFGWETLNAAIVAALAFAVAHVDSLGIEGAFGLLIAKALLNWLTKAWNNFRARKVYFN